jgi:hypothetical protein
VLEAIAHATNIVNRRKTFSSIFMCITCVETFLWFP